MTIAEQRIASKKWRDAAGERRALQTTLTCTKCKEEKPAEEFYHNDACTTGYSSHCKSCTRGYSKK